MFNNICEDIIGRLDFEYLLDYGTVLAKQEINQVILDYLEEYKVIVGEEVISIFDTTSDKVDEQLVIQENIQLIDFISDNDALQYVNKNLTVVPPRLDKKDESSIDKSDKKLDLSSTFQDLLNRFADWFNLSPLTAEATTPYVEDIMQTVGRGVLNSVNTPEQLFKIIPNEQVLNFLDNRVFVASENTLQKVGRNIYNIIGRTAEKEGLHPYDVADILRNEFVELTEVESRRIARTEILRSKNEAKWQRLNNNETVEYIQWIATVDEFSRDDHAEQADMITYMGNAFPNGQRYPYDETGDPGDYINCRCDYEAFYPDFTLMPPPDAEYWFEEDMVPNDFGNNLLFDVIFRD